MKYLFSNWQSFYKRLKKAKAIFLFLDYDGTLTPIVKKPELAILSSRMRALLEKNAHKQRTEVAIISGRSLKNIKNLVNIKNISYVGNHGLELEGPRLKYTNSNALRIKRYLDKIYKELAKALSGFKGVLIEHKGLTLSIHYRLLKGKNSLAEVLKIIRRATKTFIKQKKIKITHGKKVVEIKPKINWDKGKIVLWLLNYLKKKKPWEDTLSIYLGDDTTDEDVFNVLRNRGIGIFVGNSDKKSLAKFYLKNTKEVAIFLNRIISSN